MDKTFDCFTLLATSLLYIARYPPPCFWFLSLKLNQPSILHSKHSQTDRLKSHIWKMTWQLTWIVITLHWLQIQGCLFYVLKDMILSDQNQCLAAFNKVRLKLYQYGQNNCFGSFYVVICPFPPLRFWFLAFKLNQPSILHPKHSQTERLKCHIQKMTWQLDTLTPDSRVFIILFKGHVFVWPKPIFGSAK